MKTAWTEERSEKRQRVIMDLRSRGWTYARIARAVGVSSSRVNQIVYQVKSHGFGWRDCHAERRLLNARALEAERERWGLRR